MTNKETLANTDRTSWQRIGMVARFYSPLLSRKLILFPLIAAIAELLVFYSHKNQSVEGFNTIFMMMSVLVLALIAFAPIVFAKIKAREIETMLPALGFERAIVIICYCTIVVPCLVLLPSVIVWAVEGDSYYAYEKLTEIFPDGQVHSGDAVSLAIVTLIAMALTCLWSVMSARTHRFARGIGSVVIFYVALMALIAVGSFILGVIMGIIGMEDINTAVFTIYAYRFMTIVCGIYAIFALIKCYRAITRSQF